MPHNNPFMDSELDSESEVSSSDSNDSFEVISDFDVEDRDSEDSDDFKDSGLHEDGTIEISTPRYSEEHKAAISGEWRLANADSRDSEEFVNTTRCFKFLGDNLITYQKYQGVENYSVNDERMYVRNGKLHITNNDGNFRIYEKLTDKDLFIDKDINGTWKVTSMENFEEFKNYRNLRKEQEFLWQYGHAFYKLETDQLTRGTVINGVPKDLSLVTLNVSIEEALTSRVTFLGGDKLITVCKWMGSGLEKWRIERFFKERKLHVVHGYPNGIVCTRVLERV